MKKKKGFTLIELLAVIVVLAVLLVISVPKIIDIIEKAEMKAYKESVELMAHTAQIQYNAEEVTGSSKEIPEEGIVYEFENGEYVSENIINFKGDRPNSGRITLTQNKKIIVEKLVSKNKKWCAIKEENEKNVRVGRSTDEEFACVVSEEVVDKKACELEEGTEVINGEEKEVYYVDSVCDMYEFSNRVNNGEPFSGKVVKLRNNVDMSDIESIEDTLVSKYETTEFNPIGSGSKPFSGTFDGGAKTISNLEINKPGQDYVGLFGYINGATIYGINLENIEVIGNSNVGGLAGGDFRTTVKEISLKNVNVTGTGSAINLLVGDYWQSSRNNILVKSGEVNAPNDTAYGLNYTSNSIIENISLNGKNTSYGLATNGYYSNNCTLNGVQETGGYNAEYSNDINFYDGAGLDTWIGGDNDSSGYYFDYEGDEVVLKSIKENPITFTLKGSGTESDPYLISNEKEWKEASTRVSGTQYKLTRDLDFSNNKYYMIGSGNNIFTGIFDGGAKTIKNVSIKSVTSNMGLFGYINGATIYGINLENIEVIGNSNVGGLAGGDFRTTVKEISLKNVNVTGTGSAINLLVGDYWQSSRNNILVKSGEVNAPNDTAYGLNYTSNSIIENISLNGKNTSYGLATNGYYSNNCTLNGVQETNGFDPIYIDDINYYTYKVETSVQGDVNKTGYYFDYVGDEILVVEAGSSSVVEGQTGTSSTHAYTVSTGTDKIAPTCELKYVTPLTNGFAYTFTCTDNAKVEEIRSLFDSKPYSGDYDSSTFEKVGTKKNGSSADNNKTVSYTSRWTTSNSTSNPPVKGVCYYFSYSAKDTSGNYTIYHTDKCFSY